MSFWSVLGGVAQALLPVAGNWFSNKSNERSQLKVNRENQVWTEKFFDKVNQYNLPKNQMDRFKEAGLNPNLIYGQGNPGNAVMPSPPQRKAPTYNYDGMAASQAYLASRLQQTQINNMQKSIEVMEADKILKSAQSANLIAQSAKTRFDLRQAQELFETTVQSAKANLSGRLLANTKISQEIENLGVTKKLTESQIRSITQNIIESGERIRAMKLSNDHKRVQTEIDRYKSKMWSIGQNPNDPAWQRILAKLIDSFLPKYKFLP